MMKADEDGDEIHASIGNARGIDRLIVVQVEDCPIFAS